MIKTHKLYEVLPHLLDGGHVRRELLDGSTRVYRQCPKAKSLQIQYLDNGVWETPAIVALDGYEIILLVQPKVRVPVRLEHSVQMADGGSFYIGEHEGVIGSEKHAAIIRFVRAFDENRKRQTYDSIANVAEARDSFELEGGDV